MVSSKILLSGIQKLDTVITANSGKAKQIAKEVKQVGTTATGYSIPTSLEPIGFDGAYESSVYDAIRAHMYPQIFESYEVGKGIVKGKTNKIFEALKKMNEKYTGKKEIRLAPLYDNSLRGRNIVTLPLEAMEEVKQQGIKRIIDLRSEASVSSQRLTIKDGKKYVDGVEYLHFPVNYSSSSEDIETMKNLPKFFEAMDKGNAYIGCSLGSHRTDFAIGLNYALNPNAKEAAPVLYLTPQKVTEGIRRIYKKLMAMPPEDRKALGLSDEFFAQLPDKNTLNKKLVDIANATKEAK